MTMNDGPGDDDDDDDAYDVDDDDGATQEFFNVPQTNWPCYKYRV